VLQKPLCEFSETAQSHGLMRCCTKFMMTIIKHARNAELCFGFLLQGNIGSFALYLVSENQDELKGSAVVVKTNSPF
jgi:hypothetical protein